MILFPCVLFLLFFSVSVLIVIWRQVQECYQAGPIAVLVQACILSHRLASVFLFLPVVRFLHTCFCWLRNGLSVCSGRRGRTTLSLRVFHHVAPAEWSCSCYACARRVFALSRRGRSREDVFVVVLWGLGEGKVVIVRIGWKEGGWWNYVLLF
jgi:hypothetical protein